MERNVLYVEDNPVNFRLVARVLNGEGFRVIHARDGMEGLEKALEEQARLDLILMDINLPEIDGYEVTERLRAIPGFEDIPILALTANSRSSDRSRSLAAGCDGYITKPIDVANFAGQIRSYLHGRRERLSAEEENHYLHEHNRKLVERLEESLRTLRQTRETIHHSDRLSSVGEMAAGLMHELRNPLASISFLAEYLMADGADGEKKREYLERIVDNVDRIRKLSEGVGTFVRPGEDRKTWINVADAVEDAALMCQPEASRMGAELTVHVEGVLPALWAADGQLHHLIVNLVRNALQACAESPAAGAKGRVAVRAAASESRDQIFIEVGDNGPGVPEALRERIFDPFYTTKPRGKGTGLGLYLVQQIAADLGAAVTVGRGPEGGAAFLVALPAGTPPDIRAPAEQVIG